MQSSYQVRLKDKSGDLVAVFTQDNLLRLRVTHQINAVHSHDLSIDATADDRCDLFETDGQVEVWRRPPGEDWYLEYEGFHRKPEWTRDISGRETFTSYGVGYQDLLARRIVAGYAGSSETDKSGAAETVAKEFVDEQIVSATDTDRQIANFAVEADAAQGDTVSIQRSYRNLLEVLQEIAAIGGGDFDVVGDGSGGWEFRWYDGQRGTDRRSSLTFSTGYGNMQRPTLTLIPATANAVLVLGQGQGDARTWEWRPPSNAPTGQDRYEVARDARDTDTTATLQARGDAVLDELQAVNRLTFRVVQTAGATYGVDYVCGDLIRARYRSTNYDLKIVRATLTMAAHDDILLEFENV